MIKMEALKRVYFQTCKYYFTFMSHVLRERWINETHNHGKQNDMQTHTPIAY